MAAQQQNQSGYRHLFKRIVEATGANGLIFRTVGNEGKINDYTEAVIENAQQPTSIYSRSITAKNVRGIQIGLPANDKGKFRYFEDIEFEKTQ